MNITKTSIATIATALLSLATAIVYALADAKENSPIIIALLVVAAALEMAVVFLPKVPFIEYLPFVAVLGGLAVFVDRAFDEASDILSKANVDGLSNSYIVSAILLGITVIAAATVTILRTVKASPAMQVTTDNKVN